MGFIVEAAEGGRVGVLLGATLGQAEDMVLGLTLGIPEALGTIVGFTLGRQEGTNEGVTVDPAAGFPVPTSLGPGVGLAEGAVGVAVAAYVGLSDGIAVGSHSANRHEQKRCEGGAMY